MAEEIRHGLAKLGLRSLDELVGRTDLLKQKEEPLAKTDGLDLSFLTTFAGEIGPATDRITQKVGRAPACAASALHHTGIQNLTFSCFCILGLSQQLSDEINSGGA